MSKRSERIRAVVQEVVEEAKFSLYWFDWKKEGNRWILSVYVEKGQGEGVTTKDCARISRKLAQRFEAEEKDIIDRSYDLRVSSPGVERFLKSPAHYRASLGERVAVKTYRPIGGRRSFQGTLSRYVEGGEDLEESLVLEVEGEKISIPLEDVASANRKPELDF